MSTFIGRREFFSGIPKITYEGPESDNPLSFKWYDPARLVAGKSMEDHLRFSAAYWHSFCDDGSDPFGNGTFIRPWNVTDPMAKAENKADACFEFASKLNLPFYCFHDIDAVDEGSSVRESESRLRAVTGMLKERQEATGIRLLWNTANLFSHPRYMHGAATSPDFSVVSYAASQVKAALESNVELGGENFVFWGGREGYTTLLNTDTKRELEHFARFLTLARDYGRNIGFTGTFLVEPKPMEPTKHHYDFDASTVIGFLRHWGLDGDFKLNIEANHATLASHSFAHELRIASDAGMLGSIDANRGDPQNGWDTDQFPLVLYDVTEAMLVVLSQGGLGSGGLNFDAKLRRSSIDLEDLFIAHIGGMDCFALALITADRIIREGVLSSFVKKRYRSFDDGPGRRFEEGELTLEDLRDYAVENGEPARFSGRQEMLENYVAHRCTAR